MAKKRKRVKHRKAARKHYRKSSRRGRGLGNPPKMMGVKLPTMNEILFGGGSALALPAVTRAVSGLSFMPEMLRGDSVGNIGLEAVLGLLGSLGLNKFAGQTAGDVLRLVTVVRVVGRLGHKFSNGMVGFADMDAYTQELSAYTEQSSGMLGAGEELSAYTELSAVASALPAPVRSGISMPSVSGPDI